MKIKRELFEIKGYALDGLNPLPNFHSRQLKTTKCTDRLPQEFKETLGAQEKVLPYLMQDRRETEPKILKLKSYVLENEYLHARFLPEYGGRLHSLFDKKENKELLFTNTIIKPCNLAIRNAWLSGGIEWNVGNLGHTYTTCDNVFSAILQDDEGNDFLRIYEFERNKSIFWQIDFHLPENSTHLISHVKMINPFDKATTTYWWTNIAVPTDDETRVLSSNKRVITFGANGVDYETLPYTDAMPGVDLTYPNRAKYAIDYFIQKDKDGETTWEASVYSDGKVFYERSTAPLYYKKLFCWGAHIGGDRWQEFLCEGKGTGHYAELQAGIAPSQLHDILFPANSVYEWTQCFGGTSGEKEILLGEYDTAVENLGAKIDQRLSTEAILELDKKYQKLAELKVEKKDIDHNGSGFGALEIMRMQADKDGKAPQSMLFPIETMGEAEKPWLNLLENGRLPKIDIGETPKSYMTSEKWLSRLENATKNSPEFNEYLHLGVALYEAHPTDVVLNKAFTEQDEINKEKAKTAWLKSIEKTPNAWALRNLAVLEERDENAEQAEKYYDQALTMKGALADFALASEYLIFLAKYKKYQKAWDFYQSLPQDFKKMDRIKVSVAKIAVKLGKEEYLENFFNEAHYCIREGENSLTDVWFEYCARKMAKERNIKDLTIEVLQELVDEAWDNCPPPYEIDFRMSTNKKRKYRVGE